MQQSMRERGVLPPLVNHLNIIHPTPSSSICVRGDTSFPLIPWEEKGPGNKGANVEKAGSGLDSQSPSGDCNRLSTAYNYSEK